MQVSLRCADLLSDGGMELQLQGNIAVKGHPIRLSARCTVLFTARSWRWRSSMPWCRRVAVHNGGINRLVACWLAKPGPW